MDHADPPALARLAREQCEVARRDQLAAAGVPEGRIRHQLDVRRWQAVGPVVVVLHNGPLTPDQHLWVVVLAARTGDTPAGLAGRSALAKDGLERWPAPQPEIVVPRGARPALPADWPVTVHESRRFTAGDLHPTARPHRTRVERSAVDAAAWSTTARAACGLVLAACQQRLTKPDRVLTVLEDQGKIRYRHLLGAVLNDASGGAQALTEVRLGTVLRRAGLPQPGRQVVRLDGEGRRRYVDAQVTAPSGRSILIEVDGAVHMLAEQVWLDDERLNELVIVGERVLRFPSVALYVAPDRVVDQVARAIGLEGRPGRSAA